MVDEKVFKLHYENGLKDKLVALETPRKKIVSYYLFWLLTSLVLLVPIISTLVSDSPRNMLLYIAIGALIVLAIIMLFSIHKKRKAYTNQFKREVVAQIVAMIDPIWNYNPNKYIAKKDYRQSTLFKKHFDRYKGDDLVTGVIDKTDFQCSELHTQYKTQSKNGTKWHTIFKGLFFHADFNKHFSGQTIIAPDYTEKLFGRFAHKLQNLGSKLDLVKLENQDFERLFKVHSTNPTEARYILTPKIVEAIVTISNEYGRDMRFSFVDTRVYFAKTFYTNLFEPKIFSSGVQYTSVKSMYDLFQLNQVIVQELNLNTRIWTKE